MKKRKVILSFLEDEYTTEQLERDAEGNEVSVTTTTPVGDDSDVSITGTDKPGMPSSMMYRFSDNGDDKNDDEDDDDDASDDDKSSDKMTGNINGNMSAYTLMRMRTVTFETIIADAIDDIVEENNGVINEDTIEQEVGSAVDKAVALHKVPESFRAKLVPLMLERVDMYRKRKQAEKHFLTKLAKRLAEEEVEVPEEVVVSEEVTEAQSPAEIRPVADEVVRTNVVEVDENIPENAADAMRYLAASSINVRKSTALAIRRVAVPVARLTLQEFKNCLPKRSYKKFFK